MSDEQRRLNEINQQQGASTWLTTLPIKEEGYTITSVITNWISQKIPFALVNCVCMCVRGSRSIYPLRDIDLENDPRTSEIQVHMS